MSTKLTRRQMTAGLLSAAPLLAQAPPTPPQADDATIARERIKTNSEQIRKFDLLTATEPSFIFRP